jgi:hypothetical protein
MTLSLGTLRVQVNARLFISSCCLTNPQKFSGHSSHSEPWNPTLWIPLGEPMRTLNAPCWDFRYSFQTSLYWHGPVPPHSITKLQPFPFNFQPPSQDSPPFWERGKTTNLGNFPTWCSTGLNSFPDPVLIFWWNEWFIYTTMASDPKNRIPLFILSNTPACSQKHNLP